MVDKYSKLSMIGSGSFGKVWLVLKKDSGKKYVIKEISVSGTSEKDRQQSLAEVEGLARCRHLNIIRYKDAFVAQGGVLSIVMEWATGGDLQKKIVQQNGVHFERNVVIDWFTQICFAIKYIHERKILHRDLKTPNIFLSQYNLVKVGDFGICKMLESSGDHASTVIGTPYYLSPEICQQQPYNQKSDIWSLGCVLYELCQLEPPFRAQDFSSLVVRILQRDYQPIASMYGQLLTELVSVMLSKDPRSRPSAAQILSLPAMQTSVQTHVDRAQKLKELCGFSSPGTPRSRQSQRASQSTDKENVDPEGGVPKSKRSRPSPSGPSPGISPRSASKRHLQGSPKKVVDSPQTSLYKELIHKKQVVASCDSSGNVLSASVKTLSQRPALLGTPGRVQAPLGAPTHIQAPPRTPGRIKAPLVAQERIQTPRGTPGRIRASHPQPNNQLEGHAQVTLDVEPRPKPGRTPNNRDHCSKGTHNSEQPGDLRQSQETVPDKCKSGVVPHSTYIVNSPCLAAKGADDNVTVTPADTPQFFQQHVEMCHYLYRTFQAQNDSNTTRSLAGFLKERLGELTANTACQYVKDALSSEQNFSQIRHHLQGDMLTYFPLLLRLIQLEGLQAQCTK